MKIPAKSSLPNFFFTDLSRYPVFTKLAIYSTTIAVFHLTSLISNQANANPANVQEVKSKDDRPYFHLLTSHGCYDWSIDGATGRIFASMLSGEEVIEYSLTMNTETRRFAVGKSPERICIKNGRLVVLCNGDQTVHVINLATNRSEGVIKIDCKNLCDVLATSRKDNFVHIVVASSGKYDEPILYKVDLETRKIVASLKDSSTYRERYINGAISDSGTAIAFDRRGYSSPSGGHVGVLNEAEGSYQRVVESRESYEVIQPGPADRYWTFGSRLVSLTDPKTIRNFGGQVVSISRRYDLAVSLDVPKKEIDFWRFSSAKKLKTIKLEELDNHINPKSRNYKWRYDKDVDDPCLMIDDQNRTVFCGMRKSAFLVPFQKLLGDLQPQVIIRAPNQVTLNVGESLNTRLELSDPKLSPVAKFKLVSGPTGAQLKDRVLSWQPRTADIGEKQFLVSTEINGVTDSMRITATVKGGEVDLGISPQSWAISPSGKFAVAWGVKTSTSRQPSPLSQNIQQADLVIVDLHSRKIVNQQRLPQQIQTAAIDDQYVYVVATSSNVLNRYVLKDFDNKKRIFLPGRGILLTSTLDRRLLAHLYVENRGFSRSQQLVVDCESLKPLSSDPRSGVNQRTSSYGMIFSQLSDHEVTDGEHVYDAKTGSIIRILHLNNTGVPLLDPRNPRGFNTNLNSNRMVKKWGRAYDGSSLRDGIGNQICQIQFPFAMSANHPIGVSFKTGQRREDRATVTTGELKFHELTEGKSIGSQSIFKAKTLSYQSRYSPPNGRVEPIVFRGEVVHLLYNGKIYSANIPEDLIAKAKSPLRIVHPDSLTLDLTKAETQIQLTTPGYQDVEFKLNTESNYVTLDEDTGVITIRGAEAWKTKLISLVNSTPGSRRTNRSNTQNETAEMAKQRYQIPPAKTGYLIPLSVTATGSDGQTDQSQFCLIGLGDLREVAQLKAAADAKRAEQKRAMAKLRKQRQEQMEAERESARQETDEQGRGDNSDQESVAELKKKIRRLEALLDSLIDRIEKLEKAKN